MEKLAQEKMESLMKYVPFIDFVLEIDKERYIKFINIRKWIILRKKKYPLSDLNKIEQSIITQYKNLLLENNVKIPEYISKIFAPMNFKQFVNLCSDEEEDVTEEDTKKKDNASTTKNSNSSKEEKNKRNEKYSKAAKEVDNSDDDLEIVSIDYIKPENEAPKKKNSTSSKEVMKEDAEIDDISKDILSKIDQLTEDDIKQKKNSIYEPINYTYQEKDFCDITEDNSEPIEEEKVIFQRRSKNSDGLFKRRTDFKDEIQEEELLLESKQELDTDMFNLNEVDDEVEVQNLESDNKTKHYTKKPIEIISLDSCSDDEDDNQPSTSKAAALKSRLGKKSFTKEIQLESTAIENEKITEEENSNSNCSNSKVELLCNTIDSAFLNVSDLMEELNEPKELEKTSPTHISNKPPDKQISETSSDKENIVQSPNTNTNNSLSQEQICQLLADISNKKDFDMETFYAALSCVKQMNSPSARTNSTEKNSPSIAVNDTPPPAPPPINNIVNPPVQPLQQQPPPLQQQAPFTCNINQPATNVCYPPQQPQHLNPPSTPYYPQNANFVPAVAPPPPRPKVNINDPRIIKQLQVIQNSPLFTYNVLNSEIAENIMQICQSQKFQQPQQTNFANKSTYAHNNNNMIPSNLNTTSSRTNNLRRSCDTAPTTSSRLTYGEYKRRQQEQKLQLERQREEERKAKAEQLELEKKKMEEEIRSKLLSTLTPCTEQLTTMWSQQKNSNNNYVAVNNTNNTEKEKPKDNVEKPSTSSPATVESNAENKEKKSKQKSKENKKSKPKDKKDKETTTKGGKDQKLNRVYNELRCTVKGFDQLHDYIPNIEETTKSNDNTNIANNTDTTSNAEVTFTPRPIGLRRRSSIHALSAITEQLGQQSSDCSDSDVSQKRVRRPSSNYDPKRPSIDSHNITSSEDSMQSLPKRRKTIDEIIKPNKRTKAMRIADDDSESSSEDENISKNSKENLTINQPVIKLRRISQDFIRKHTNRRREDTEPNSRLKKNCEKVLNPVEPAQKVNKLKRYNNDCQMTERNTSFCVLCRSKPSDLTNHYIGRHKTESYVARLDWAELDDLSINTPFAKLLPRGKNARFDRYEVECPFCQDKITDQFINLYQHYSVHTGEYAFQCSHCNLTKPYRPDIQSHILHSKTCRNATIQIMYRYPPNAQCIYLHYCTICNFVQLNEANVLKHLREHHDSSKAIPSNVQKYILAAMSDGPDINEANKPPTPAPTPPPAVQKETTIDEGEKSNGVKTTCKPLVNHKTVQLPGEVQQTVTSMTSNDSNLKVGGDDSSSNDLNFKIDDDDIPVGNEPCCEEEFLEEGKYSLEEQLKQLHEGPTHQNVITQIPMTVVHCIGDQIKQSPSGRPTIPNTRLQPQSDRHLPMILKIEPNIDVEENLILTPPRPTSNKAKDACNTNIPAVSKTPLFTIYEKYRSFPQNVNYLGLYKCMIDDCYYSTDCPEEFFKHLTDHSTSHDSNFIESYLQCPYCVLPREIVMNPMQLVEHVRNQHGNLIYQCSMCCYRSCDASNVYIHQQLHHNTQLDLCKIYKCIASEDPQVNIGLDGNLNEQIVKNVFKIVCSVCQKDFYHTQPLIEHLTSVHKAQMDNSLKIYSCVYCSLMVANKNEIRMHVSTKHPGKHPYIYDHNTQCNSINEDLIRGIDVLCLSEAVAYEEIQTAKENDDKLQDIKPDFKQLQQMNEETVRVRLRKLTAHTGVQPDKLYRCPHSTCGGFFTIFDLWLRHMKVRHQCLECQCPHCPTPKFLTVEQFALHFEEHRRHTFICYYCPTTWRNKTLAMEHAIKEHSNLGPMRFEQIRFNLTYSYAIMIQNDLLTEHENFIAEFLLILDNRLKVLESNEKEKLKHQWPVSENTLWVDDYLHKLHNRKVVRTCLMKDCPFRTVSEDNLFAHLRTSHVIAGTSFNCSKCNFSLSVCTNIDEVINHIKLHNEFICICAACSLSTPSRQKMSNHIRGQHSARDVPVIQLFKTNQQLFIKLFIVFADNHLTFSTMKNCFCCGEKNMEGDVFSLHLKRYHKFSLNYYCEKCPDFQFKSLKDVKSHFQQLHSSGKFKIRTELASANDIRVNGLNDFQVEISMEVQTSFALHIKDEPIDVTNTEDEDDDVILLEDNDVVIQDSLRDEQVQQPKLIPQLKCASFSKLIEPSIAYPPNDATVNEPPAFQQLPTTLFNSISTEPPTVIQANFLAENQGFHQNSPCNTVPNTRFMAPSYENQNINVSMNPCNNLNPNMAANDNRNTVIHHNNTMRNPVRALPTINKVYTHQRTNNPYMGQTRFVQIPANMVINQNYGPSSNNQNDQNIVYQNLSSVNDTFSF
ncbi:uncharacterized protein LOC119603592 [Lucilia sericata]|uniref:uncharacterized protein LOC119603592 n=1 Tax=Lucilia sericata TaxID=13632 RepID=UPI0018A85C27|nr:uncharacterized protein LOC119603592 [Lucilia sericata]